MTNPDDRCSQNRSGTPPQTPIIPQPIFDTPNQWSVAHNLQNYNNDDPFLTNRNYNLAAAAAPNYGVIILNDDDPVFRVPHNHVPGPLSGPTF
jgi:hypothetical protein